MALTGIHLSSAFDNQTNKNCLSCIKQTRGNVKESCNNIVLTTDFDEAPNSSYGGFRIN